MIKRLLTSQEVDYVKFKKHDKTSEIMIKFRKKT